jgi:predicted nucleotidyltransferase
MDDELRGRIVAAANVLRECGATEVYLFGSAAADRMRPESDIDLAVSGLPPRIFYRAMSRAGAVLRRPLMLIDLDEDNRFTRYLKEQEGVLQRVG